MQDKSPSARCTVPVKKKLTYRTVPRQYLNGTNTVLQPYRNVHFLTGTVSHSKEEGGAFREEDEGECGRQTRKRADNHVYPPGFHRHGAHTAVGGVVELTNHNPGHECSEDGAQDPESGKDDDKRSSRLSREKL
jgi:hypothetical protein